MKLGIFDHMQKNDKPERSYADMYANHPRSLSLSIKPAWTFTLSLNITLTWASPSVRVPGPFLGAASQRTKKIRLGPLVYVLPLWNPIRVAEEVAFAG